MLRLKLHILLFLCPVRLLPFLLLLPDTLLPAFQAFHYCVTDFFTKDSRDKHNAVLAHF